MKTYQEVLKQMIDDEAFAIAINGGPSMIYMGTHLVEFIYGVSTKQIYKDIKAGLTPEVLKNAKKAYNSARRRLIKA
jgi:hypothetical protein